MDLCIDIRTVLILVCISLGITGCAHTGSPDVPCRASRDDVLESRQVKLQENQPGTFFYYRSGEYVILAEAESLLSKLDSIVAEQNHVYDRRLLTELRRMEVPTHQSSDLFRPVLSDPSLLPHVESLLVALIQEGKATVVTMLAYPEDEGRINETVLLLDDAAGSVTVCTRSGNAILLLDGSIP